MPFSLKPAFQAYAWGDRSFIQRLCGLSNEIGKPLAEMWLGAHPQAPSLIETTAGEMPLDVFLAQQPEQHLGKAYGIYGGKLPFLLKVLAAEKPLSIQVHPDKLTAKQGFATENEAGIALSATNRSFKDDNHKPELILALTPFTLMRGFRQYDQIINLFQHFAVDDLWSEFRTFSQAASPQTLSSLFRQILDSPPLQLELFIARISAFEGKGNTEVEFLKNTILQLNSHFPLDSGIVSPLLLNTLVLSPGQAVYLDAGILHAYIQGAGIELMANSDNVIRAGLTPKHIDRELLFRVTDFNPSPPQILDQAADSVSLHPAPAKEFELLHLDLAGTEILALQGRPAILLCLSGKLKINHSMDLARGEAAFISASEPALSLIGKAELVIATIPA